MESPFNRPVAANLIGKAIEHYYTRQQEEPFLCGFSLEMFIYDVLNRAQYLTKSAQESDSR